MRAMMVGLTAALLGAFGASGISAGDKEVKRTVLMEDSDGKTLTLNKDDEVEITLKANPTTGFRWQIVKNNPEHFQLQGKSKFERPKDAKPGAGGTQIFRLKAVELGTSELELIYRRPFEKDGKPARSFRVVVEVK